MSRSGALLPYYGGFLGRKKGNGNQRRFLLKETFPMRKDDASSRVQTGDQDVAIRANLFCRQQGDGSGCSAARRVGQEGRAPPLQGRTDACLPRRGAEFLRVARGKAAPRRCLTESKLGGYVRPPGARP